MDQPIAINDRYPCLCCGYLTRRTLVLGDHTVCEVCDWVDDPGQFRDVERAGLTNRPSLVAARAYFETSGAISYASVTRRRAPERDEEPRYDWASDPNGYRDWLLNNGS